MSSADAIEGNSSSKNDSRIVNDIVDDNVTINNDDVDNKTDINNDDRCWRVNTHLIPAKAAYIFKLAIYDKLLFSLLFYTSVGLSAKDAGLINGFQHIGGLLGAPVIAFIADKTRLYRMLAILTCVFAVLVNLAQPVLGVIYGDKSKTVCPYIETNETSVGKASDTYIRSSDYSYLFYTLMISSIVASAFETSGISFVDSGSLQRMRTSKRPVQYGRQRVFGGIGMSGGSVTNSLAITYFPIATMSCYNGIFATYAVFGLLLAFTCYYLFKGLDLKPTDNNETVSDILWSTLRRLEVIFFYLSVLSNGIVQAILYSFTYMYMKEVTNAPTLIFGLGMTVAAISSLVIYTFSERIITLIGGPLSTITVAWLLLAVRSFVLAYTWHPYFLLFPEAMVGCTYSLFWVSSIKYINNESDPGIVTTMCGLLNSLFNPCSYLIANVGGGYFYQVSGGKKLFVYSSMFCCGWGILTLLYVIVKSKKKLIS